MATSSTTGRRCSKKVRGQQGSDHSVGVAIVREQEAVKHAVAPPRPHGHGLPASAQSTPQLDKDPRTLGRFAKSRAARQAPLPTPVDCERRRTLRDHGRLVRRSRRSELAKLATPDLTLTEQTKEDAVRRAVEEVDAEAAQANSSRQLTRPPPSHRAQRIHRLSPSSAAELPQR